MQKQDILAAKGLERIQSNLDALTADSIGIKTHPVDVPVGASHLGGWPDLTEKVAWPQWKGQPLGFIAQFNLAEVHPFDHQNLLPAAGWLFFFFETAGQTYGDRPEDRGGWKVIHWYDQSGGTLKRVQAAIPESAQFHACAVEFLAEATLPLRPQVFGYAQQWTEAEQASYETLMASELGVHHRLLGHADAIQDDMHLQAQLLANGQSLDTAPDAQLQKAALDWVLLFQCDTDPNTGMNWANNGRLYYWIQRQALQAGDFEDTWMILQSE